MLLIPVGLLAAGLLYQAIGSYRDARRYAPHGRLIDAGCVRLHLYEQGTGEPAVILESGIAATSLSWALVQPEVAAFTRVCSYDRAGLGWSDACAQPRTVEQMVFELSEMLDRAGIPGPYILVGHSFGGLLIRAYAHFRPNDVTGLVFVDPVSLVFWASCPSTELDRLGAGVRLSRRGAWLARFGIVRLALAALLAGGRRFPKLIARATAGQGRGLVEHLAGEIRKLPPDVWPTVRAHWSRPKCFEAMAQHLEILPESARQALRMSLPPEIPLVVLSAESASEAELAERDRWVEQSRKGRHIRVPGSGHWLQLETPGAVVEAIRQVYKTKKPLDSPQAAEGS